MTQSGGFFACWWWGLHELYFADKFNLIPVIDWTNKNAYYEENGVEGLKNPFEYYFKQVSNITVEEATNSSKVYNILNVRTKKRNPYLYKENISELVKINKKYMKLKENVNESITKNIKELLGNKKTLAVHVRGVEWGNVMGHPIPLTLDKYIQEIDKAMTTEKFEQIFLATDSDDTIECLSNKYKGKIVYYKDVARASKGSKTLALFDTTIQRENNHYLLGLEVLRDMMTLASCQGLIAGLSNISLAAEITKQSNDEKYDYKHIFEQKINNSGMTSKEAVDKMKNGKFNKE